VARIRIVLLASLLLAGTAQAQPKQLLLTANETKVELRNGVVTTLPGPHADSLSIYDIASSPAKQLAQVALPVSVVGAPQSIGVTPDLGLAIVTAATRIDPGDATKTTDGNTISLVDLDAQPPAVVQTITTGPAPAAVAISPDGRLVLVGTRGDSAVLVFALEAKRLRQVGRLALPEKSVPGGIAITPDGRRALVARDGDSTVTVLSIEGTEVKLAGRDFFTGVRPYGVQVSRDSSFAVVGNVGRGAGDVDTVALVDLRGPLPRTIDQAVAGPTVEGVSLSPDGRHVAAVVHDGSNRPAAHPLYRERGQVVLFRIESGRLVPAGSAPIGAWAQGSAFSADSSRLFVQSMVSREIQVFRIESTGLVETAERIALQGGGAALTIAAR